MEHLKKTYSDYLADGFHVASGYYAEGFHYQVLQGEAHAVIAQIPHGKIAAEGFVLDSDVRITRFLK